MPKESVSPVSLSPQGHTLPGRREDVVAVTDVPVGAAGTQEASATLREELVGLTAHQVDEIQQSEDEQHVELGGGCHAFLFELEGRRRMQGAEYPGICSMTKDNGGDELGKTSSGCGISVVP
jgi:hypothetical protein